MRIRIGHIELNGNTDLEQRFDPSQKGQFISWTGKQLKISSVDVFIEFGVCAISTSTSGGLAPDSRVHVSKKIKLVINAEDGRSREESLSHDKFLEKIKNEKHGFALSGWAEGPNKFVFESGKEELALNPKLVFCG